VSVPVQGLSDVLQRADPNDEPEIASYDFGFKTTPLAVLVAGFDASAQADHILVTWETVSEVDNTGFNLYRSLSADGEQVLLAFTPSAAPGSAAGAAYRLQDFAVQAGQAYWYWLEAVDLDGAPTRFDPVSVTFQVPTAVTAGPLAADSGTANAAALPGVALALLLALAATTLLRRHQDAAP
jgi:hypothetical protein